MSDETPALYRKEKTFRSSVVPSLVTFRSMKRIERAVDFDRVDLPRRIFQFSFLWPSLGIEGPPTPRRISPSGYADSNVRILPHVNYSVGSALICPFSLRTRRIVGRRIHVANPCRLLAVIGELVLHVWRDISRSPTSIRKHLPPMLAVKMTFMFSHLRIVRGRRIARFNLASSPPSSARGASVGSMRPPQGSDAIR